MKRILTAIIILASIFVTTCDNIALGTALNLKGPVVEITGPISTSGSNDPEVGTLFDFWGTASSDSSVVRMTITLTYYNRALNRMVVMGREWKWEGGAWFIRENTNLPWSIYTQSTYQNDYDEYKDKIKTPSWTLSGRTVFWSLPVYMNRMEKGSFFITATAWDNSGNSDSNSSKRIKVEFSNDSPTIKIDQLSKDQLLVDGQGSLAAPTPPDFSGTAYKFDPFGDPQQTYENRINFVNKFKDFRWTADHSAALKELTIEITNQHNLDTDTYPRKLTYYKDVFTNVGFNTSGGPTRTSKGNHIDTGSLNSNNGTSYMKVGNEIVLDQGDYYDEIIKLPKDRATPLQIVTTLIDDPGKKEYKSKGWFLWLPDSDKPYVDITFGFKVKDGQTPPADACERMYITRGTKTNRLTFYDDKEGLESAEWTLYKLDGTTFATEKSWGSTMTFSDEQTRLSTNFEADYGYGTGRFKLEITPKDISGTTGDKYIAYFTIVSNTAPEILSWPAELALPDGGPHVNTRWGDTYGTFTFWGRAAIEGDELQTVKVNRVTVVLLNYENGDAQGSQNELRFTDPAYSGWNTGNATGFTDSYGNKIWEIPEESITFYSGGAPGDNLGDNNRDEYKFTKDFNWFNDLNGNTSTKDKKFIVRALSRGLREFYSTKTITIRGDNTEPVIDVTTLELQTRTSTASAWQSSILYKLPVEDDMVPALTQNSRIRLLGSWYDDSASQWSGAKPTRRDLFKSISVRWEGTQKQYDLVVLPGNINFTAPAGSTTPGKWETDWFAGFPEQGGNTDPVVTLAARFEDLAGNPGLNNKIAMIETDTPTLARVTSESPNGRYGVGKPINITLAFNKAIHIDVTDNATLNSSTLYLTLNNGARATYSGGLGTIRNGSVENAGQTNIKFTYTVGALDNEINYGRLNVTAINYGDYAEKKWKSASNSDVIFPPFVFTESNSSSLAGQKNIIVDRTKPVITGITSSAAGGRTYGLNQEITFIVEFDEDIDAPSTSNTATYLSLAGGNLTTNSGGAKATYSGKAGARSVQFLYTTRVLDFTQTGVISVSSVSGFDIILDKAGNKMDPSPSVGTYGTLAGKQIKVDTVAPDAPVLTGFTSGATSYGDILITIGNVETGARVEYNTSYADGVETGWTSISASGSKTISLTRNGAYTIAARQYDTAQPENVSLISNTITAKIDSGAILTKVTSSSNSGNYGFGVPGKQSVDIVLEFRIPVTITNSNGGNAYITLNTTGGVANANRLYLPNTSPLTTTNNKLTLKYDILDGVTTNGSLLNATGLYFDNAVGVKDNSGEDIKTWISLSGNYGVSADNQLNKQKEIIIINGRPAPAPNNNLGTLSTSATQGLWFNGTELGIKFDRAISRGGTSQKLIIRQIATDYRIPAVLSEQKFNDIFLGRSDMFTDQGTTINSILNGADAAAKAVQWKQLGDWLYEKGSNGATAGTGTGNPLTSDTSTKYVLRYTIGTADTGTINNISGVNGGLTSISMTNLATLFRFAEALTFSVNDPSITITTTNHLVVALTGARALPVRGATYDLIFPNGFVQDILGRGNGGSAEENDNNITSNGATRQLNYINGSTGTGLNTITVETPTIRIDKGDDRTYFDTNFNDASTQVTDAGRQARQRLTTKAKMDCRTPGATIAYRSRNVNDPVGTLIMRANPGDRPNQLPNLGSANTYAAWEAVRLRPQSGGGSWATANGLNHYAGLYTTFLNTSLTGGTFTAYSAPVDVGTNNYSDGGQEFNFSAKATLTNMSESALAYETAYRSVFVYHHANVNGNGTNGNIEFANTLRVWIRGSNTAQGEPTVADFPLSRNESLYRKIKLLTPITLPGGYTATTELNQSNIVAAQANNGRYAWFWVTWRINVPAFVDLQIGTLQTDAATGGIYAPTGNVQKLYKAWVPSNEHYAVHPGRTTVVETRQTIYVQLYDGEHGELDKTSPTTPPGRTD